MIAYVEGQILFVESGYAVVVTNGVGYHVLLHKKDLESLVVNEIAKLHVHTHMREDAFELYGFRTRAQKQLFLLLISVSGVGPKLALSILATLTPSEIIHALINKDIALLSSISGIGKKTAERLSLELKEKAMKLDVPMSESTTTSHDVTRELEQAIRGLGYSKSQSDRVIKNLTDDDITSMSLEALIKKTLSVLTGNNPS